MSKQAWQSRTELLVGAANITKLNNAHILVIGLGGVGSVAAEMICRAGVGTMTIADGDIVQSSNRNRQLPALSSTVGSKKASIMAHRLKDINPEIKLHIVDEYLTDQATIDLLHAAKYDYVIDAIDTLSPKVYLIYHAMQLGLKLVSSMGAAGKFDSEQVKIVDISKTFNCNFAHDIRKRLRRLGINQGFKVVFSPELVDKATIQVVANEKNKKSVVGTISYLPPIFGCFCASVVIRELLEN